MITERLTSTIRYFRHKGGFQTYCSSTANHQWYLMHQPGASIHMYYLTNRNRHLSLWMFRLMIDSSWSSLDMCAYDVECKKLLFVKLCLPCNTQSSWYSTDIQFMHQSTRRLPVPGLYKHPWIARQENK